MDDNNGMGVIYFVVLIKMMARVEENVKVSHSPNNQNQKNAKMVGAKLYCPNVKTDKHKKD